MRWALGLALLSCGCAADDATSPGLSCDAPLVATGEACTPPLDACPEGVPRLGGGCAEVGVDRCDEGFSLVGRACRAIQPASPCAEGEVALPGETTCHPLQDCGSGTWGAIPLEPDALFVDAAAAAGGDGTRERPYRTIGEAITAGGARVGSPQIAIAAGTYVEQLVAPHPVRLFGRCPALVDLRAPETTASWAFASGQPFELHGLSIRGGDTGAITALGVALDGAPDPVDVVIDRVRVHGNESFGIGAQGKPRTVRLRVVDSLIEDVAEAGITTLSSTTTIERTVVRRVGTAGSKASTAVFSGRTAGGKPGSLVIRRSLFEHAPYGISILAGEATVESTLLRDLLRVPGVDGGAGVSVSGGASLTFTGSSVERAQQAAILVSHAAVTFERATIRDVLPSDDGGIAEGLQAVQGASVVLRSSTLSGLAGVGVFVGDSAATLEATFIHDVGARVGFGDFGAGIAAQADEGEATVSLRDVRIEATHVAGIQGNGATLDVASVLVTGVKPQPVDGLFGDGVAIQSAKRSTGELALGHATLKNLFVRDVARAGVSVFGAGAALGDAIVGCSAFPLALSEAFAAGTHAARLEDLGGNACGCTKWGVCHAQLQSLGPIPDFTAR